MALGWSPGVVYDLTLWEIMAAIDGHNRLNATEEALQAPSDEAFDKLLAARNR